MPNIVAHNHISAHVYGPELTDFMLGSTLPDFQGMYNARYAESKGAVALEGLQPMAQAGAQFHKLTDTVFDSQPEIPQITGPLSADLQECGVPYKAARLSSAFLVDILLDRQLIDCAGPSINFNNLRDASMRGEVACFMGMDARLVEYIKRYLNDYGPSYYKDSRSVVMMTADRLRSRSKDSRRRILPYQVPVVEQVIENHADRAGDLGLAALSRTIEMLSTRTNPAEVTQTEQSVNSQP